MALRDELEKVLQRDFQLPDSRWEPIAAYFLRDNGKALLEAVRDGERIQWLQDTFNKVSPEFESRPKGYTGSLEPTGKWGMCIRGTRSAVFKDSLREAIDAAMEVSDDDG